ncbi:ATP-binding cassette domain-containing protein [Parabacteroides sp. PF5-6]|uniref:ATP-binding cassette domain-containing protein n=1 Tax=Parabacteroides sp. PF5-6 TaxID=1742403 RepID=UPI0024058A7D|nr:ATP-binding cassette domain-containing protein [Parabacteroides sp. PF5-6]MDF9831452.1 ABC-type nitrate/sulfonate/bicarbonate transport system ATPase subunit/ABC-type nitrate/sulfonate/bicarbonate transport system permease component [Parabacteroides sp. PF5-6]
MGKRLTVFLSIATLLLVWQLTAVFVAQPEIFPSLPRLLTTLIELVCSASFYLSVGTTVLRGLAGMGLSLSLALLFAGVFARWEWLYELFRPLFILMRSIPVVSFILLALIFLHTEGIPLLIGFLTMFPLLTENLTRGFQSLDPGLRMAGRQFRLSRRNRFTQIVYPQLKPFLFSGVASAAGFGWRAIIMGEVLAQCATGIGSEMKWAQSFIDVPGLLAWTLIAVVISYLSDKGIQWLSKREIRVAYRPAKHPAEEMKVTNGLPIEADHLSYPYGVAGFTYRFDAGKIYGISAPSGTGKTTLLNLLNGTLLPVEGTLTIDRSEGVASVFQEPLLLSHLTVRENISLVIAPYYSREEAEAKADIFLRHVELHDYASSLPAQLSYGQQQRVAIARALAYPSPFLFMDEPFKGLDRPLCQRLIIYLRQRQEETQQTVLFTSHQADELSSLADTVVTLNANLATR